MAAGWFLGNSIGNYSSFYVKVSWFELRGSQRSGVLGEGSRISGLGSGYPCLKYAVEE